jgi:hypothetical protein
MILLYGPNPTKLKELADHHFPTEKQVYTDTWAIAELLLVAPGGPRKILVQWSMPIGKVPDGTTIVRV